MDSDSHDSNQGQNELSIDQIKYENKNLQEIENNQKIFIQELERRKSFLKKYLSEGDRYFKQTANSESTIRIGEKFEKLFEFLK